jgi:hypothetical protein
MRDSSDKSEGSSHAIGETHNAEGRIVGATAIVGPSTRRKSTVESMFDQAQKTMSGQLSKMRWGLGLNVPVPMCPFVAAYLRRHPEQRDLVVAA